MPPKRKAAGGAKAGGKKAKKEEPAEPATLKDASAVLKAADKKSGVKKSHKPDSYCPLFNPTVSMKISTALFLYLLSKLHIRFWFFKRLSLQL